MWLNLGAVWWRAAWFNASDACYIVKSNDMGIQSRLLVNSINWCLFCLFLFALLIHCYSLLLQLLEGGSLIFTIFFGTGDLQILKTSFPGWFSILILVFLFSCQFFYFGSFFLAFFVSSAYYSSSFPCLLMAERSGEKPCGSRSPWFATFLGRV